MSLLNTIKNSFSQVSDFLSKPNIGADSALNETNKTEKVSLWNLFDSRNAVTPSFNQNIGLNRVAQNVNLSNDEIKAQASNEAARLYSSPPQEGGVQVPVVLRNEDVTPQEEARAILTGLKFKDSDIKAYNEHYQTDLVRDLSIGLGGKKKDPNAGRRVYVPSQKKDVFVGYIQIDAKTHKNLKDFLNGRRAGTELPTNSINNITNAGRSNAQLSNTTNNSQPTNVKLDPVKVTVGTGTTVGSVLIETMPPQISTDIVPRAIETAAKVAPLLAETAAPLAMIAAEAAPTALIADHLAQKYIEAKGEFERGQAAQEYDLAREAAKATTLTMTMDDAEPLPQPQSEAKPKDRSFAEPVVKPKVQDLPDAPTDLIPQPQTKPETKVKPETTIDDLPQPFTPDVPKGTPQSEPPKFDPSKVIPPIIAGASLGKLAIDKLTQAKVERTEPSLAPNPNRIPEGKRTPINTKDDESTRRGKIRENKSADILAQAGYKIEQNPQINTEDLLEDPSLAESKDPDFRVQGKIFDCYSPTRARALNLRDGIASKTNTGQTTRLILNLEDSSVSLDDLKQVLRDTPINNLKEIIIIKNGKIEHFFPFEN